MTVLLALAIPGAALLFMLLDGRRHHRKQTAFRQRSHVRIVRPERDR